MTWIRFLERPELLYASVVEKYDEDSNSPFEIPGLENPICDDTGLPMDPPWVIPHNKRDSEWEIGDEGGIMYVCNGENRYYRFVVIESPIISKELRDKINIYEKETKIQ